MEMSENIYANSEMMEDTGSNQSSESSHPYEDAYSIEGVLETKMSRSDKGAMTSGSRCYRLAALCLSLLCVLLLAAITVLLIMFSNLTVERDQLATSYANLTTERDQLQTSNTNLTTVRDQLQTSNTNLTIERDQLHTRYTEMMTERDQLKKDRTRLQKKLSELEKPNKDGWRYFNFHFYFLSNEKKSWSESREDCKNRSGDLVVINSQEEQEFITRNFVGKEAWIGLTDSDSEGVWQWVDNSTSTTAFWWQGEPNNLGGNEDCARTGYSYSPPKHLSTWVDYSCTNPAVGLCERKPILNFWWQEEPSDYGGNEDCARNGYKLSPRSNVSTRVDYPCTDPAVGLCEGNNNSIPPERPPPTDSTELLDESHALPHQLLETPNLQELSAPSPISTSSSPHLNFPAKTNLLGQSCHFPCLQSDLCMSSRYVWLFLDGSSPPVA
ncbi:C-type lectin domain family 4 member K-like [Hoplias malabaricus]|uniref:C-type lectin domain family 4 member K-like n=1 Tax=Hoplias malabaricus TaxID=27720 RepID=UPI0034630972